MAIRSKSLSIDWKIVLIIILAFFTGLFFFRTPEVRTQIIRVREPRPEPEPKLRPEPVRRQMSYQQVGMLTANGGSSSSAAPDRTILPLFGLELDPRRSRWSYYTRTDGVNPVQVPVRYRNRACDDDINGCDEIYNDESVQVPALGRSFKATVYVKPSLNFSPF